MSTPDPFVDPLVQILLDHPLAPGAAIPDVPFPVDSFPPAVAAWLGATADATRVPVSFVAMPFLAFTGALVGRQLALEVGPGWRERPILWVALVASTGFGKTPALAAARGPFMAIQEENWRAWHDHGTRSHPVRGPHRPPLDLLFSSAATMPGLAAALEQSAGVCLLRDELYGLVRALDRRQGEDRQHFLALWSGEPLLPTGTVPAIPAPVAGIVGGIQPLLLRRIRNQDQDGFLERFLLVYPTARMDRWHEAEVAARAAPDTGAMVDLLRPLRSIPEAMEERTGVAVTRTPGAAAAWEEWFNDNLDRHHLASVPLAAFYRKLPSHLARIALVLHALWQPDDPTSPLPEETMRHAVAMVDYLRVHEHRAGALLGARGFLRARHSAFSERIMRILAGANEDDGWLPRSRLLVALGRPDTARFNDMMASLERVGAVASKVVQEGGPGRPATVYRLRDDLRQSLTS